MSYKYAKISPFVDVKSSGCALKLSGESTHMQAVFSKKPWYFYHDFLYDHSIQ